MTWTCPGAGRPLLFAARWCRRPSGKGEVGEVPRGAGSSSGEVRNHCQFLVTAGCVTSPRVSGLLFCQDSVFPPTLREVLGCGFHWGAWGAGRGWNAPSFPSSPCLVPKPALGQSWNVGLTQLPPWGCSWTCDAIPDTYSLASRLDRWPSPSS